MASYLCAPSPMTGAFVPALLATPSRIGETSGAAAALARNSRRVVFMPLRRSSEEFRDGHAFAVPRHVHGTLLDDVRGVGRNAQRVVHRRVQMLCQHGILDGGARTFVRGLAVEGATLDAPTEHQHAPRSGEMPVH